MRPTHTALPPLHTALPPCLNASLQATLAPPCGISCRTHLRLLVQHNTCLSLWTTFEPHCGTHLCLLVHHTKSCAFLLCLLQTMYWVCTAMKFLAMPFPQLALEVANEIRPHLSPRAGKMRHLVQARRTYEEQNWLVVFWPEIIDPRLPGLYYPTVIVKNRLLPAFPLVRVKTIAMNSPIRYRWN